MPSGDGVVHQLAAAIAHEHPGVRGYTQRNLFCMRQFFEAYRGAKKVSPLVTQLPWTQHLIILSQTKASGAGLIVMGAFGHRGLREFFLGSTGLEDREPGDKEHGCADEEDAHRHGDLAHIHTIGTSPPEVESVGA